MKTHKLLFWAIMSLFLMAFSCGGNKGTQKGKQTTEKNTEQKMSLPSDFEFSIEKTPCHGTCPIYKAYVNSKGEVMYQGKRFTEYVGEWKAKMSKEQLMQLYNILEQANLFQYEDEYDNKGITDLPSTILHYKANGKSKTIRARYKIPTELEELQKQLHTLIHSLEYTKVSGAANN